MSEKNTTRPFVKIDTQEMRSWLPDIGAGELKTWLAYKLRANAKGEAWPGLATLSKDTGISPSRISRHRSQLIKIGALVPLDRKMGNHDRGGRWGSPKFRVAIPQIHRAAKTAYGKNTVRLESEAPHGENDVHRTVKTAHEVDVLEVDVSKEECAGAQSHFGNRKMADPRFAIVRGAYIEEFGKRSPNLKAPFDASDGKTLKSLLNRQPAATAEELSCWLRYAFASDDVPPLRPAFRLREFCAHAEKFANGPLKRGGAAAVRSAAADSTESSRLEGLVIT
jgi:Helix-turn-helix domain